MTRKKQPPAEHGKEVVAHKLTERERAALDPLVKAMELKPPAPGVKVSQAKAGDKVEVVHEHQNHAIGQLLLMRSVGSTSQKFADGILNNILNIASTGGVVDQQAVNFALAVVDGIKPRDELEAMLAVQMAAIHRATITQARRLANSETIPQQDSNERVLNKLARTFTAQMETLKRYRTGGEQKVTVHHVTVNEGGQAIVGTVEQKTDRGEG